MRTESRICLPPTKAFWELDIRLSKTLRSLDANTLDNSLYKLPTRLMGRKSLILTALIFLGMSTVYQFVYSETTRMKGLLTPISRGWGSTPAYGMQITGQQEEDLKRSTGPVHPLLQNSVNLGQGLACGKDQPASVNVLPTPLLLIGILPLDTNSWVLLSLVN